MLLSDNIFSETMYDYRKISTSQNVINSHLIDDVYFFIYSIGSMKKDIKGSFLLFAVLAGLTLSTGNVFAQNAVQPVEQQKFSAEFVRSFF